MLAIKDQAIVLRRLDYSETSQVLAFMTREHGGCRLIAKWIKRGTKKKFATGIDLLERGQVVYIAKAQSEHGLGTLTEWRQNDAHLGLRDDLKRWYAGQYAAEITAAMIEQGDPHPELFDSLAGLLADLSAGAGPLPLVTGYQCDVVRSAGLWPDLSQCVICNRTAPDGRAGYFSAHQGGLICRDCEAGLAEKRKVSAATLTALRQGQFTTVNATGVFELLNYVISHVIGRAPAVAKFVTG